MKSKSGKLLMWVLSGLFVLAGLGMASYGLPLLIEARQSASWQAVEGRITHSEVVDAIWDSDDRQMSYKPNIRYSYRVDGVAYQGTRFSYIWRLTNNNRNQARRYTSRYPVKMKVQVYYDPCDMHARNRLRESDVYVAGGRANMCDLWGICFLVCPSIYIPEAVWF